MPIITEMIEAKIAEIIEAEASLEQKTDRAGVKFLQNRILSGKVALAELVLEKHRQSLIHA